MEAVKCEFCDLKKRLSGKNLAIKQIVLETNPEDLDWINSRFRSMRDLDDKELIWDKFHGDYDWSEYRVYGDPKTGEIRSGCDYGCSCNSWEKTWHQLEEGVTSFPDFIDQTERVEIFRQVAKWLEGLSNV